MNNITNLKQLEKKTFRLFFQDGLWDIYIGMLLGQFVIIPLFINKFNLGDFWSAAVMLPVFIIALIVIMLIKRNIVTPRIGIMKPAVARKRKLGYLHLVLVLLFLSGAFIGYYALLPEKILNQNKWFIHLRSSIVFFLFFAASAYFLDVPRFLYYGILLTILLPLGEMLFQSGDVSHHGYPLVFGIVSAVSLITGLYLFITFLKKYPRYQNGGINGILRFQKHQFYLTRQY